MKRPRSKNRQVQLESDCLKLSEAKTYLGRLVDKVRNGEAVYIVRGQQRFVLQEVPPIDPIPMRPRGYFAHYCSKSEIAESHRLAKASVRRPPKDLE
jgi:hypothetical protein